MPTVATGILLPASQLGAPQTICKGAGPPMSTVQTLSFSALGWGARVRTWPMTTPGGTPPTWSIPSTSSPADVSFAASSLAVQGISM